jgi:hypothetical protein
MLYSPVLQRSDLKKLPELLAKFETTAGMVALSLVPDSLVPKLHIWSKNMEYAVVVKHVTVHIHKADN